MNPVCERCNEEYTGMITRVTMGAPAATWDDIKAWHLCPKCAMGLMVYVTDKVPLDFINQPD